MEVLHIINSLNTGGAQKLILDSIPSYHENNIKVSILTLKNEKTFIKKKIKEYDNVECISLFGKSVYNPLLIFKLIPYLKKNRIIHVHLFPTLYWVVFAKLISFSNIKIFYTEHNTDNRRRNGFILKRIDRFVYSKLTHIGCISEGAFKNLIEHLNYEQTNISMVYNGINLAPYRLINFTPIIFFGQEDFILIQVSSFKKQKDQATVIRALQYLPDNIKLILVGKGELKIKCEELTNKLNLSHRVRFMGVRDDVPQLFKSADIVVQSSNYEGFGLVAIEGMAAGKAVIASDVEGLNEVVKGYGILFEKNDSVKLADEVLALYEDREKLKVISDKCFKRALDFDISKMVEQYLAIYSRYN